MSNPCHSSLNLQTISLYINYEVVKPGGVVAGFDVRFVLGAGGVEAGAQGRRAVKRLLANADFHVREITQTGACDW